MKIPLRSEWNRFRFLNIHTSADRGELKKQVELAAGGEFSPFSGHSSIKIA